MHVVDGDDPASVHQQMAATLDACHDEIRAIQDDARRNGVTDRPSWPAIVLRTPKGWTGPKVVNGLPVEGTFRSHQVPLSKVGSDKKQLEMLEQWLRSYLPEQQFDESGSLLPELAALAPTGDRRMGANPIANGGRVLVDLVVPDFTNYAVTLDRHGVTREENTRPLGKLLRDVFVQNKRQQNFRVFCPDELASNRLDNILEVENRCYVGPLLEIDSGLSHNGRVLEVLSEHLCEGWLEGYTVDRSPRLVRYLRSLCHGLLIDDDPAHEVASGSGKSSVAGPGCLTERAAELDQLAKRPQRLQSPGAGSDRRHAHEAGHRGADLPSTGRELPALGGGSLPA